MKKIVGGIGCLTGGIYLYTSIQKSLIEYMSGMTSYAINLGKLGQAVQDTGSKNPMMLGKGLGLIGLVLIFWGSFEKNK